MFTEKVKSIKSAYDELTQFLSQPDAMDDQDKWRESLKKQAELAPIVEKIDEYLRAQKELNEIDDILNSDDKEMIELAKEELNPLKEKSQSLEEEIKVLLIPKDENDDKNVVLEIRAGTGGEEAALFGMVLLRMYMYYAEKNKWTAEIMDISETDIGGCKEATVLISGRNVYSRLKFESGGHRVQRVPETESGGRIHTSAATVVIMPEAEDVDYDINPADLRIDTYRASGAGGQHVNKTSSAIRIIHEPTGIMVTCQDEKSQTKNKAKAMRVLKTRIMDMLEGEKNQERAAERKGLVGSGDRSGRIRTYNYPQGRVTDHRINLTLYKLDAVLQGDLDEIIEALIIEDRQARMEGNE
ncbi:MAG: peptide chain release factor 1 [Clostridia bacterium]|nr:peptide chain release factor 1 [Clostridia bacterium]